MGGASAGSWEETDKTRKLFFLLVLYSCIRDVSRSCVLSGGGVKGGATNKNEIHANGDSFFCLLSLKQKRCLIESKEGVGHK